jgi:starch-binding outer membrane protein, SusD/RagB family
MAYILKIIKGKLKRFLNFRTTKQLPKFFLHLIFYCQILGIGGCKKLVDIPPPTQTLAENKVYATDATAVGVLDGIYANLTLSNGLFQGRTSISVMTGLSADELNIFGNSDPHYSYYRNNLSGITNGYELWSPFYNNVYKCNAAIEGLQKSTSLTGIVKQQLLGEAKFMRAFFYFYLANLFGDVPLALSTDPVANTLLARSPKADVYSQVITDLKEAKDLLNSVYPNATLLGATTERIRPTKWAAEALLARVYLFTGDYVKAEEEATGVINYTSLYGPLPALNNVFLKNSKEAIWQLQPTTNNLNTIEGQTYIIPPTGSNTNNNPVFLSKYLLGSFELGDQRAIFGNWIDTTIYKKTSTTYDTVPYPFKYKIYTSPSVTSAGAMTEYFMVLRLGEQYLIRAEARARTGTNLPGAIDDLDKMRTRAGLLSIAVANQSALIDKILHERQVELFCEWGHRWLDLKRTGKVDAVLSAITPLKSNSGIQWRPYQQYYPLAKTELDKAPNLMQTPGYQ